jgi:hypothetical protein
VTQPPLKHCHSSDTSCCSVPLRYGYAHDKGIEDDILDAFKLGSLDDNARCTWPRNESLRRQRDASSAMRFADIVRVASR